MSHSDDHQEAHARPLDRFPRIPPPRNWNAGLRDLLRPTGGPLTSNPPIGEHNVWSIYHIDNSPRIHTHNHETVRSSIARDECYHGPDEFEAFARRVGFTGTIDLVRPVDNARHTGWIELGVSRNAHGAEDPEYEAFVAFARRVGFTGPISYARWKANRDFFGAAGPQRLTGNAAAMSTDRFPHTNQRARHPTTTPARRSPGVTRKKPRNMRSDWRS